MGVLQRALVRGHEVLCLGPQTAQEARVPEGGQCPGWRWSWGCGGKWLQLPRGQGLAAPVMESAGTVRH